MLWSFKGKLQTGVFCECARECLKLTAGSLLPCPALETLISLPSNAHLYAYSVLLLILKQFDNQLLLKENSFPNNNPRLLFKDFLELDSFAREADMVLAEYAIKCLFLV